MKDDNFQKLVGRYTTGVLVLPSSKANRMFSAALTIIMSHLPSGEHQQFMDRVRTGTWSAHYLQPCDLRKGNGRGISGFVGNRGEVNRGFTVHCSSSLTHLHHQVFGPIRDSTVKMLFSTEIAEVPGSPVLTQQVLTALDTFHGIAAGIVNKIVE